MSISCEHILYSHVLLSLGFYEEDWFSDVERAHVLKTALTKGWAAAKPMLDGNLSMTLLFSWIPCLVIFFQVSYSNTNANVNANQSVTIIYSNILVTNI